MRKYYVSVETEPRRYAVASLITNSYLLTSNRIIALSSSRYMPGWELLSEEVRLLLSDTNLWREVTYSELAADPLPRVPSPSNIYLDEIPPYTVPEIPGPYRHRESSWSSEALMRAFDMLRQQGGFINAPEPKTLPPKTNHKIGVPKGKLP